MKYLWYGFLGLFSLGFLGMLVGVGSIIFVIGYYSADLPDYNQLKEYQPKTVSRLYAGDGLLMAEYAEEKRVFMTIDTIPDLVKNAFIAAEDKNFYTHGGVDFFAVLRAALGNLKEIGSGRRPKGASTITQQVAKNFLLTNEVSYERKVKEAILAQRMERAISKDRLLELYLNEIYLGARAYGVAAAALQYFDKALDELDVAEVAYLAALPKAPNNYHPVRKHDAAVGRRNWVINRMYQDGYIERDQAESAKEMPLKTSSRSNEHFVSAPYFAEEIRRELADRFGEENLYSGGFVVRGTLDSKLQRIATKTLREGLVAYDHRHGYRGPVAHFDTIDDWRARMAKIKTPRGLLSGWELAVVLDVSNEKAQIGLAQARGELPLSGVKWARKCIAECYGLGPKINRVGQVVKVGDVIIVSQKDTDQYVLKQVPLVQGALIAMDPHTGRVLAMEGGWKYEGSKFNRATQAQRQIGSAFKPFVYLAALENGFTPATLILDAPFVIEDRPGNYWSPTNYSNKFYGPTPLRMGIEKSRNLMTVRLAQYIGMDVIADYAKRFGIDDNMPPLLANSLGAGESTLLKLTSAYSSLINGGKKIQPTLIDRIQDRYGSTVFRHDTRPCENCGPLMKWKGQDSPFLSDIRPRIADPRAVYQITSILEGVVKRGTGVSLKSLGRPLGGKTGTTNESKDTWFIGFSSDLVVGVFAGFDQPRSLGKRETGSSVALPIFKAFMEEALKDEPVRPFHVPPGIRNVRINAETGVRARGGERKVLWESFIAGTEPTDSMFILDGVGISKMNTNKSEAGNTGNSEESANVGTGGIY